MIMNKAGFKLKSAIKYYLWKNLRESLMKIPLYRQKNKPKLEKLNGFA